MCLIADKIMKFIKNYMITTLICCTNFRRKIEKYVVLIYLYEATFYMLAMKYSNNVLGNETTETVMLVYLVYHTIVGGYLMNKYFLK